MCHCVTVKVILSGKVRGCTTPPARHDVWSRTSSQFAEWEWTMTKQNFYKGMLIFNERDESILPARRASYVARPWKQVHSPFCFTAKSIRGFWLHRNLKIVMIVAGRLDVDHGHGSMLLYNIMRLSKTNTSQRKGKVERGRCLNWRACN